MHIELTNTVFLLRQLKHTVWNMMNTFGDGLNIQFSDLLEVEFRNEPIDLPQRQVLGVHHTHVTGMGSNVTAPVNTLYREAAKSKGHNIE